MYMLERFYEQLTYGMKDRTKLQAINITNAARWYFEDSGKDEYVIRDDFPAVVPPFDYTWMEFQSPRFVNRGSRIEETSSVVESVGCIAARVPVDYEERVSVFRDDVLGLIAQQPQVDAIIRNALPSVESRKARNDAAIAAGHEARWIVTWKFYAVGYRKLSFIGNVLAYVDFEGKLITENYLFAFANGMNGVPQHDLFEAVAAIFFPVLFATSLMHAKNVTLVDNPMPVAVAKRRQREGKPVLTFKTLDIKPMRKQAMNSVEGGSTGTKRAMHIVRGHFKDYRSSGGLFGKHKGLYWWDMHVAGDEQVGKVIKDYQV